MTVKNRKALFLLAVRFRLLNVGVTKVPFVTVKWIRTAVPFQEIIGKPATVIKQ